MSKDVWVTGGRGFIGRHLSAELSKRGCIVRALGHGAWIDEERNACGVSDWLNASVTAASLDALATHHDLPSVVYHLAGGSNVGASLAAPREDFGRTVEATAELIEWIRTRAPATRVVAVSSAAVYGGAWRTAIPVQALPQPCSPYGAHKAAMEVVLAGHARSFGLSVAIVRLFSVYGPGLEKQLIWDLCSRLARGGKVLRLGGSGAERRDFVYVSDAVSMLVAAGSLASTEPAFFNGGTGHASTVRGIAELLTELWPARMTVQFDGISRPGDPVDLFADTSGSEAILPLRAVSLEDGLRRTVEAVRQRLRVS